MLLLSSSCQWWGANDGFDEGHEWIMPRPAAEIHLLVVNSENEPVQGAMAWIYLGDQKVQTTERFLNYNGTQGVQGDDSGEVILYFLGDEGGGYEVPLNAPGPPEMKVKVEAQGYTSSLINLDDLLFLPEYRVGHSEMEYNGEKIEMAVIEFVLILEEE